MNSKQMRERKFQIMKSRSHPGAQPRDYYQDAHLRNADRNHNALIGHMHEMEVYARWQAKSLEAIADAIAKPTARTHQE